MKRWCLLCAVLLVAAAASVAQAITVQPDGLGDYPTIADAIAASTNGDVIQLTDGTFTGPGNRGLDFDGKRITIESQSQNPNACIIDCEQQINGFFFTSGETSQSILRGITIANGRPVIGST
jgi:hypothetical protein